MTIYVKGYAAHSATNPLEPFNFERRDPRENDVVIEILYTGICHSDIHTVQGKWTRTQYPCVPGHEIIGRVIAVGNKVHQFNIDDVVGVGCLVHSCQACNACDNDLEQHCEKGFTGTYNGRDTLGGTPHLFTMGGYSEKITVDENFVLRIPANLDLAASAPLLCAGITTYSPLKKWKVGPHQKVGIIGLGGLGHVGVKLAHAMGAHVVMITTSLAKAIDAKKLGADEVLLSTDEQAMKAAQNSFDFLLNTIPVGHDINPYLKLLKQEAKMVIVGSPEPLLQAQKHPQIEGSILGGLAETQEMLDFCSEHNIVCDIEKINVNQINEAYERTIKGDIKYRFVINIASLRD